MIRLNLVLSLAVLVSALYLVTVQYESRQLFSNLDKAHAQERKLMADNAKLQVEKRAQATSLRVEKLAREKLQMRSATPAIRRDTRRWPLVLVASASVGFAIARRAHALGIPPWKKEDE